MNTQEQFAQMERRIQSLERRAARYRLALVALVLALVGVALVGATGDKDAVFDTVTARYIKVMDRRGLAVEIGSDMNGGRIDINNTRSRPAKSSIALYGDGEANSRIAIMNGRYTSVLLGGTLEFGGYFSIYGRREKKMFSVDSKIDKDGVFYGGELRVLNKTGESVVYASVDDYGNGFIGAYNRKGKGRELKPGP